MERDRLPFLDGLRALAALAVVLVHSGVAGAVPAAVRPFIYSGARGVQLFFVISGFLMVRWWHDHAGERGAAAKFYLRRFVRLAPLYYLAIALGLALEGLGPRYLAPTGITWPDVLANIAFLQGWIPNAASSVVVGGWSISAEMMYYLAVPCLLILARGPASSLVLLLASFAIAYWTKPLVPPNAGFVFGQWASLWPPAHFPAFCAGIAAYCALDKMRDAGPRTGHVLVVAATCGYVALVSFGYDLRHAGVYGVCFAVLLVGVGLSRPKAMTSRPAAFLGRISYSIYVVHPFVLSAVVQSKVGRWMWSGPVAEWSVGPALAYVAVGFGATIAVSSLTYRFVEKPANDWAHRQLAAPRHLIDSKTPVGRL